MTRNRLTTRIVWRFMTEGCNANEIAAYGGVKPAVALAMMAAAARKQSAAVAKPRLTRAA